MDTLQTIKDTKLVAIIRNADYDNVLPIAKALYEGGIRAIEVTMNTPKALEAIELITTDAELKDKVVVGAGTVLDPETARLALLSGAQFILSPTFNRETIEMTKRYGAISIPGAMSPTEILEAYSSGADIVKVFPTTTLGPAYIKDLQGPLSQIPLLPTGGVNLDNVADFIKAGAVGCGLGSALVNTKKQHDDNFITELTKTARAFYEQANGQEGSK